MIQGAGDPQVGARKRMRQWMLSGIPGLGLFALAVVAYIAVEPWFRDDEVSAAIRILVREEHRTPVRIADLTRFEWDQLYVFDGYELDRIVCEELSLTRLECIRLPPEVDHDGYQRLLFRHRGRMVHSETHSRFNGDIRAKRMSPLSPGTAVFDVKQDGMTGHGEPKYILRQALPVVR